MSRTYRIRHLPRLEIAHKFAWGTDKFSFGRFRLKNPPMVPIISPHWHPWVRYRANQRANVWYRKQAHKTIRKIAKHLLNRSGRDYDAMLMPKWREYFDTWNFT